MTQQVEFYLKQAASCGEAAAAATLANEREKFLGAQAAWLALAESFAKVQEAAAQREAERHAAKSI